MEGGTGLAHILGSAIAEQSRCTCLPAVRPLLGKRGAFPRGVHLSDPAGDFR